MRGLILAILTLVLIGCRHTPDAPDEEAGKLDTQSKATLQTALECERAYVHVHMLAVVTATELSNAAVEACDPQITQAVDAYIARVLHTLDLTARQVEAERVRMHAQIADSLRSDALRLTVEARTPPK